MDPFEVKKQETLFPKNEWRKTRKQTAIYTLQIQKSRLDAEYSFPPLYSKSHFYSTEVKSRFD